jgi:hypothetical protein
MKSVVALGFLKALGSFALAASGLTSIDTGAYTPTKVSTALSKGNSYIVAGTYQGTILALGYDGQVRWKNKLSGFMNHDIWCDDINGDGNDEILAANADGSIYCINHAGKLLWNFKPNEAPMYSVCTVQMDGTSYVVCGGYDKNIYYLSKSGEPVKVIPSSTYSQEKTWGKGPKRIPPDGIHSTNFLRPLRAADGKELLLVNGAINTHSGTRFLYLFSPLSDMPVKTIDLTGSEATGTGPVGDVRIRDTDGDGLD